MIRFLSVCSGLEGASLAFEPLGWTAVGFAEIKPFPCALLAERYGSNLPGEPLSRNAPPNFGDFTTIDTASLGEVDILVGGTPCQAFSVAGKRLSLADARGNLTLAFGLLAHELVRNNGLRNVIWENVVGVLSSRDNAFGCFLGILVGADDALLPCERPRRGRSNQFWRWEAAGRKPVLDDDGEPTGETVETPEGHIARWPRAGMASGPRARLAWIVRDAQYFGLAQRRERVFVVVDFGNGADPVEVLFEPASLRRDPPTRGRSRKDVAGDFSPSVGIGCVARTVLGGGHSNNPLDENLIAHALRGEGFDASEDGTGRGTPLVPVVLGGVDVTGYQGDNIFAPGDVWPCLPAKGGNLGGGGGGGGLLVAPTLTSNGDAHSGYRDEPVLVPVAFAIQERAVSENPDAGPDGIGVQEGVAYTLDARSQTQAVAFAQNTRDEVRLQNGDGSISGALSSQPGMKQTTYVAQAFDLRGRDGGAMPEGPHDTAALRAASGGSSRSYVAQGAETRWAVRRLTPREAERLQGVPDNYTRIAWRGRSADECPDGPRYESLGNSWAVPVVRWIGERLDRAMPGGRAP